MGKFDVGRVSLDESHYVVAWPLLSNGFDDVYRQLYSVRKQLNLDVGGPEMLIECIVSSAWRSGRPYWMRLAVPWAGAMVQSGAFDVGKLRTLLVSMSKSELISADDREFAQHALATVDESV
ncbi:hypothetical protein [Rugosimonospora africana]|uniref:hypothetical protein n=1 Tax=Rugosimonospora africana TaxID=556532 RepID=UPI00194207C8|nr:hypothetical protein [Rugosimonospora africana]